ncbi:MAG TPA: AbgT family transporter [Planctomycetota bacterium]|nr:AbgT family transporter [Planctomycetota bacterium]
MNDPAPAAGRGRRSLVQRVLDLVERAGNRLPDPAVLFLLGLVATWVLSKALSGVEFAEIDPRTVTPASPGGSPIRVQDMLTLQAFAAFLSGMVRTFTGFPPLGVVLVALLGVGVAEHAGFIDAAMKALLAVTPRQLLTPILILVGLLSHTAADAGFVLVIPLGGVLFAAAGRHPLAGIAAAFAGVSGGFSANPLPCGLDPLLSGLTQAGAGVLDPTVAVNPLCNYYFTASSSVLIVLLGWLITDFVVEPRLRRVLVDGDPDDMPPLAILSSRERKGLLCGLLTLAACLALLAWWALPAGSALRAPDGSLTKAGTPGSPGAPLMAAIVPLIFLLFVLPGVVHGYVSGRFRSHRDIVTGMARTMGTMGYYLVMVFFAALFIDVFNTSGLGALLALKGATALKSIGASHGTAMLGLIGVATLFNLLIGSASAKWALLAPIFVPMFMSLGLSPELTQATYRVGDSCTDIITPMMPYFPLVVVFCQRYVKSTGIGTLTSLMLPYSVAFLVAWTAYLLLYRQLGLPLGVDAPYVYTPGH